MAEEQAAGGADEGAAPKKKISLQLILLAVNLLAILVAVGTVAYTRFIWKKPKITEAAEMEKIKAEAVLEKKDAVTTVTSQLEELRINIASNDGKNHYVTFSMAVECVDEKACSRFEARRAIMMDRIIQIFNRKMYGELSTLQGRLILKEELLREFNEIAGPGTVSDVMYSNFVLQ